MRFTLNSIPTVLLLFLPLSVAWRDMGIIWTTLVWLFFLAIRQVILFYNMQKKTKISEITKRQVYTIESLHISQFVEKVRWCLDYTGIPYIEQQDVGLLGAIAFGRMVPTLHIPLKDIRISNSSDILRYIGGVEGARCPKIRKFFEADMETLALEQKLDWLSEKLRGKIYFSMMADCESKEKKLEMFYKTWGLYQKGVPEWQKWIMKLLVPVQIAFLTKIINLTEEEVEKGNREFYAELDKIDAIFSDGRKYVLGGSEPTYIDFALASLFCHAVFAPNMGGPAIEDESRFTIDDLPTEQGKKEFKELAKRPSMKFTKRMYKQHRMDAITSSAPASPKP